MTTDAKQPRHVPTIQCATFYLYISASCLPPFEIVACYVTYLKKFFGKDFFRIEKKGNLEKFEIVSL